MRVIRRMNRQVDLKHAPSTGCDAVIPRAARPATTAADRGHASTARRSARMRLRKQPSRRSRSARARAAAARGEFSRANTRPATTRWWTRFSRAVDGQRLGTGGVERADRAWSARSPRAAPWSSCSAMLTADVPELNRGASQGSRTNGPLRLHRRMHARAGFAASAPVPRSDHARPNSKSEAGE